MPPPVKHDYQYDDQGNLKCPQCGNTDGWVVSFIEWRAMTALISNRRTGAPEAEPQSGYGDSECSQDETWTCQHWLDGPDSHYCEFEYRFGRYTWVPEVPES